ncbi:MAG: hypothetical protein R3B06_21045 [Kofleriaceae bacterium]
MSYLVGNLACEVAWAGGPPVPAAVGDRLARLATTLRALATDADTLWLPGPVADAAVPPGGPRPRLVTGPVAPADQPVVAWGADAALDARPPGPAASVDAGTWQAAVRTLPVATVALARAANDRRLALAVAADLGTALPGAQVIASVAELRDHLAAGGAAASPTGTWVAKAVLTAAGRDRVRRRGPAIDAATAVRLERLLARHQALVVEPWMERRLDVGQGGVVLGPGQALLLPPHRAACDGAGVVRALTVDDGAALAGPHRAALAQAAAAVAHRLGATGYRGPFVVDAFVHADGFHPLCEINARLTFGMVARAWAEHLGRPITLGLDGAPPAGATPLVLDAAGRPAAWWAPA